MDDSRTLLDQFDLLDAPGHLIRRVHQRSYDLFAKRVGSDVTRQQIALLLALERWPGVSQNQISTEIGLDRSTIKEMLGRMVQKGWVERTRDQADGRSWKLRIAPAGQALLIDRIDMIRETQDAILAPLPEDMRQVFLTCLRTLLEVDDEP